MKGIHQIQNLDFTKIADDRVDVACAIVLLLRVAAGSPIRLVAVGRPWTGTAKRQLD